MGLAGSSLVPYRGHRSDIPGSALPTQAALLTGGMVFPGPLRSTARRARARGQERLGSAGPLSTWGFLLGGGIVVGDLWGASSSSHRLLSLWGCCAGPGLISCSQVAFPLNVLDEQRLVSLKVGVAEDLK